MNDFGSTHQVPAARLALSFACAVVLTACGGGGGGSGAGTTSVASAAASGKYSQPALVTISGSGLDQAKIAVSSPTCTGMALSTDARYVSSATTAYYQCTTSGIGAYDVSIVRASDGAPLATAPFTVPVPQVTMKITYGTAVNGDIVITLAPDKTPLSVNNFLAYVNSGFYNGTTFHRITPDLIQGGGFVPGSTVEKATNAPIPLEVGKGLSNVQWSIGMARAPTVPDSATSQFYVNAIDNSAQLDPRAGFDGFAVFGTVSSGTALVSALASDACLTSAGCVPPASVVIASAVQTQ